MILLAISGNERFEYSDMELVREGTTYTVDTFRQLKEEEPKSGFYFILGADSFFQFTTWKEPEKIASMVTILAASRYGIKMEEMERQREYLSSLFGEGFLIIKLPQIDISSKGIRERRKHGESVRYLVPEAVYRYIAERGLYQRSE
jgi:nicotinate-nucleotide adenylyltransferase